MILFVLLISVLMIIQILFHVNFCVHMSVAGGALCADQTRHYTTTHTRRSQSVAVSPMAVWHPVNCAGPITELLS